MRYAKHTRENPFEVAQGPNWATDWQNPAGYPTGSYQTYPSGFNSSLGGNFPVHLVLDAGPAGADRCAVRQP